MNTRSEPQAVDPSPCRYSPWLERFAWGMVVTTFCLLILGGTVTSKDAGLAVPDWPQSFGYNMFLYPPSQWMGGIFWEHTHRLLASLVGLLALIMAGWALLTPGISLALRILATVSLQLVIIQGVMGGLRVTEVSTVLGVVHGVMGQLYFCLTIIIAMMTSRMWINRRQTLASLDARPTGNTGPQGLSIRTLALVLLTTLVIQLTLGAVMRHYRAGLAIPDFPSAYGQVIPPLTSEGIRIAMDSHVASDQQLVGYYSPFKVSVHFAHRLWAISVVMATFAFISTLGARGYLQRYPKILKPAMCIVLLLVLQLFLGASVIWTGRHAEVATAHQVTGAAILGLSVAVTMLLYILPQPAADVATEPAVASSSRQTGHATLAQEAHA